jgi:ABC-type spermidine/putrescine transport system permease subunit II
MTIAFPAAYALAFKVSDNVRRWAIFLLIIPFFTSYLVRIFSWYVILAESGVVNAILGYVGLGPYTMLNTKFGTIVGYMTLTLPLVVILQTFALANIDTRLVEAAHNLGCKPFATVWRVVIPLAKDRADHRCAVLLHPVVRRLCGALLSGRVEAAHIAHPDHRHHQIRPAMAARGGGCHHDDGHAVRRRLRRGRGLSQEGPRMSVERALTWFLRAYVGVIFVFVFTPIVFSLIFSFNSHRFPTIPLGEFSTQWYETASPIRTSGRRFARASSLPFAQRCSRHCWGSHGLLRFPLRLPLQGRAYLALACCRRPFRWSSWGWPCWPGFRSWGVRARWSAS